MSKQLLTRREPHPPDFPQHSYVKFPHLVLVFYHQDVGWVSASYVSLSHYKNQGFDTFKLGGCEFGRSSFHLWLVAPFWRFWRPFSPCSGSSFPSPTRSLQVCSAESMGVGREFGPTAQFSTDRRCQQMGEKRSHTVIFPRWKPLWQMWFCRFVSSSYVAPDGFGCWMLGLQVENAHVFFCFETPVFVWCWIYWQ